MNNLSRYIWVAALSVLGFIGDNGTAQESREERGNRSSRRVEDRHTDRQMRTTSRGGEQWRYRRHNGEWWYWSPRDRWLYYRDGRWNVYYPRRYAPGYVGSPYDWDGRHGYGRFYPDRRYYDYPYGYADRRWYSGYPGYYGDYYRPPYNSSRGFRRGANIGGAIGGALGGDVGAGIGSAIGGAIGDDD